MFGVWVLFNTLVLFSVLGAFRTDRQTDRQTCVGFSYVYIILCLLSFRKRNAVASDTSLFPTPCLSANELRTYSDASKLTDELEWLSLLRLDELREGKYCNSGGYWLEERLATYLICVSHLQGWISLFNEFWLFSLEADWRRWKIWSRDKNISYPANVNGFCARNNSVAEDVKPEYRFCVFIWVSF